MAPGGRNKHLALWEFVHCVDRAEVLSVHSISECMIDKDFFAIVSRCATGGVELQLNTNGSVCTERHLDVLESCPGIVPINFSLDAATPEMFTRIRGWDFLRVLANIRAYVGRFQSRRARTQIMLSFVITKDNVGEMVPFVHLAKALDVDSIHFWTLHEYDGLDWQVETKDGQVFDYRRATPSNFVEEFQQQIEQARQAAAIVGIYAELTGIDAVTAGRKG